MKRVLIFLTAPFSYRLIMLIWSGNTKTCLCASNDAAWRTEALSIINDLWTGVLNIEFINGVGGTRKQSFVHNSYNRPIVNKVQSTATNVKHQTESTVGHHELSLMSDTKLSLMSDIKLSLNSDIKQSLMSNTKLSLMSDTKLSLMSDTKLSLMSDTKLSLKSDTILSLKSDN